MSGKQTKRKSSAASQRLAHMREFAKTYNNYKMCPLIHDLIRVLFPESTAKDKLRLLRRRVEAYRKFRKEHPEANLPELILRNTGKDGRMIGVPPGVLRQLDEFRIDPKKLEKARGVVVTSAQFGGVLNTDFWKALKRYAEFRGYVLVVMPIKYGPVKTVYQKELDERVLTSTFSEELKGHMIFENVKIARGALCLNVLRMRPTLSRFLTDTICQRGGNTSQIFAAPKLELEHRPRVRHDYPKAIMTTGAVTHPNYNVDNIGQQDRTGEIAAEEHTYAAVVVEFAGGKTFHYRQLLANTVGEFYDIDPIRGGAVFVTPKGIQHRPDGVEAIYFADWHTGKTHPDVRKITFEHMVPQLKPKHGIHGDFFDGDSITHHDMRYASRQAYKGPRRFDSLQLELDQLIEELNWMHARAPDTQLHVLASNHHDFLGKYIEGKRWMDDPANMAVSAKLFAAMQDEMERRMPEKHELSPIDPIGWWIRQHAPFVKTHGRKGRLILPEGKDSKKILCSLHGDIGPRGQRGPSMAAFRKWNQWVIVGHAHDAAILGPVWRVGTATHLIEHYVSGPSTNWTHTHAVIYANGQRQLLNIVNGSYHGIVKHRVKSAGLDAPVRRKRKRKRTTRRT